jgi:predicted glycosyltransferase
MAPRVLFYVQHLLGIGHQRRGATLTRALRRAGLEVTFVSGGHEIPNLDLSGAELVQLPATRAVDLYFKELVDENDLPIDDAWRQRRRALLLEVWRSVRPDLLLFELFPFGRRQMRFELLPLIEAARASRPRPLVVSSVRDILVAQPKPERNDEILELVERHFDHVLVHGDPAFIALDRTFPHAARIADKLRYTGYVVDESGERGEGGDGDGEVLVSSGGGAVGLKLLQAAIAARPISRLRARPWRVLAGLRMNEAEYAGLSAMAPPGVLVERARGDFPSLLMRCHLSISQAGYNTLMEAMRAGCRAVVVPYAGGLETEQTLRARLLAERSSLQVVEETELDAASIAAAADRAEALPPLDRAGLKTDGAARSAELLLDWLAHRARQ